MNRIAIPKPIINTINLKIGDTVYLTCDAERIYITPKKEEMPKMIAVFDRDKGLDKINRTSTKYKKITETKSDRFTDGSELKINNLER